MAESMEDIRNVAVVGHRGVGKTALIEAMLYLARAIPKLGSPSARLAGLDATAEEKAHLATLETRVVSVAWNGKKVNLLDTPGEASFSGTTRLALAAADAAILLVSAREGVQSGTERVFRYLRRAGIPCIAALTHLDDAHARLDEVVADIRARLDEHVDLMEVPEGVGADFHGVVSVETGDEWHTPEVPGVKPDHNVPGELRLAYQQAHDKLVDDAASADDTLTERYLEKGELSREELDAGVRAMVARGQLLPLFLCSPVKPAGVAALLDAIVALLPPPKEPQTGVPAAFVFKTRVDPHAGRTSWLRVKGNHLPREVQLLNLGNETTERMTQLMALHGAELKPVTDVVAGDIVAALRVRSCRAGDTLVLDRGPGPVKVDLPSSVFSRAFLVENRNQEEKLSSALHQLAEEDPSLLVSHEGVSKGLVVSGVGTLHLDVAAERVRRMTGLEVKLGPPRIAYRETLTRKVEKVEGKLKKQSGGHGQYAVVYVDVEPLPRGAGFVFEDAVVGGAVPRQFIPSVEKGVRRALARGVLAGYPVEDVKVRLVDGKSHSVDSSDAAFQSAGFRAFLVAAEQAGAALLEPIMKVQVRVPDESMGDVIGSLTARNGKVLETLANNGWTAITARVPMSHLLDYEPKLTAMTSGRGSYHFTFEDYDFVPPAMQKTIVAESGFKPDAEE